MTLTLIHCTHDQATILTDTLSYTKRMTKIGHSTKVAALHHLDAAITTRGDSAFCAHARVLLEVLANEAADVEDLIERAAPTLAEHWQDWTAEDEKPARVAPVIFIVGRARDTGGYVAWGIEPLSDWKPWRIEEDEVFVYPAPLLLQPSAIEQAHLALEVDQPWFSKEEAGLLALAKMLPPCPAPESENDLVALALLAREQRGVAGTPMETPVGGELYRTSIEEGLVFSSRVYAWDSEEELLKQVGWSAHPIAQMRPCHCDSEQPYRDCHLRPAWLEPCDCGSPSTFYECCLVPEGQSMAV